MFFLRIYTKTQIEGWVIPFLYVWMEIITVITITQFWILAADYLIHVRQSGCSVYWDPVVRLGAIIIGSSIKYYVSLFGSENLLFATIGFLGIVILMANLIRPYQKTNKLKNHSTKKDKKQQTDKFFTPYLKSLAIIIGLAAIVSALLIINLK
ncbi:MAG: hypothetical protein CM1200mP10_02670 [Candidatus Neomarinimicrobiota bacterium]|nr:MAG: hypothetical protein CM1200mP10_02670 [Candidatus Neomarinimicrobiota bacterium]